MEWCEITVKTKSNYAELAAEAFVEIGCVAGVRIIDKNDIINLINTNKLWDYIDGELLKSDDKAMVSGFVGVKEADNKICELESCLNAFSIEYGEISTKKVNDEDWYENWKKYYKPIIINKFAVVPTWLKYADDDKIKIFIDPGMAFGTGEHESTKLCLQLLSNLDLADKSVIDVGTGSGILGIAALKSGAKSCYMCDIDSIAIETATKNVVINQVEGKAEIETADLLQKQRTADVVLANLTANLLIKLSENISDYLNDHSILICSGIINSRKEEVIAIYKMRGFVLNEILTDGEWTAIKFTWN